MLYRFAAACALGLELLLAGHVIEWPLLHEGGPLAVTGAAFGAAFIFDETRETLWHCCQKLRGGFDKFAHLLRSSSGPPHSGPK